MQLSLLLQNYLYFQCVFWWNICSLLQKWKGRPMLMRHTDLQGPHTCCLGYWHSGQHMVSFVHPCLQEAGVLIPSAHARLTSEITAADWSLITCTRPCTKGLSEAGVQLAGRTTWKREMCQMGYQGSAGRFWSPSSGWQGLRLVPLLLANTVNPIRPVEKQSVLSCGVGVGGCCLQRRAFVHFSSLPATNSCRQMPVLVWTRDFWITLTPHGRLCWEVDLASDATAAAVCVRRDQSPFSLSWFAQLEMCNHGTST